ncbi:MAG: hypothetical protein WCA38_06360, partial [Candidatus Acidiferrales bacterium]
AWAWPSADFTGGVLTGLLGIHRSPGPYWRGVPKTRNTQKCVIVRARRSLRACKRRALHSLATNRMLVKTWRQNPRPEVGVAKDSHPAVQEHVL